MKAKKKLVFFVQQRLDAFIDDIIKKLSDKYDTKKVIVKSCNQINEEMKWADICWFEWCDWIVIYGSNQEIAKDKKIICRIHSYEAFTNSIFRTNWNNIDKVIFVSENIRNIVLSKVRINRQKTVVIPNGVDLEKYSYKERRKGFNIAFTGYINFKKGPMLLLHTFKAIFDKDNRYKLYIAGRFQEQRYLLYFNQMKKEMGLENNVIFDGWQNDINKWLEDKNYILCTSVLESQNMGVMQSMSKGIKPVVHNFVGAKGIYHDNYVWNSIDEAVKMITSNEYDSKEYKSFIADKYSLDKQNQNILNLVKSLTKKTIKDLQEVPLVTVGIINYNCIKFLDKSIMSVLNQDYTNIELLIIDDFSTDGSVEKIKKYEEKYNNIRGIYHSKNTRSIASMIREISEVSKGKYILSLPSECYLSHNNVISTYLYEFNNSDLDYVYGNFETVDYLDNKKNVQNYTKFNNNEILYNTFNNNDSCVIPFSVCMFRNGFYDRNKLIFIDYIDDRIGTDVLIYVKHGENSKFINFNTICHRYNNNISYHFKRRVKLISSVTEYIIRNFNEKIYFPTIQWDKYNGNERRATKMYTIANYYWKIAMKYYNKEVRFLDRDISLDKEQIKEYIQPLINLSENYLDKSINESKLYAKEIDNLKIEMNSIKIYSVSISKNSKKYEIYKIGMDKRETLLKEYKNKYLDKNLKVLIHSTINGAWYYDFMNWKDIFEYMGIKSKIVYGIDPNTRYDQFDIFINIADKFYIDSALKNKSIMNIPKKVGICSKGSLRRDLENINLMTNRFKYSLLISTFCDKSISVVLKDWINSGLKIKSIPFGFNPIICYPELVEERYDYFFVGTNSRSKTAEINKYLLPIIRNNKGILRGNNWIPKVPYLTPDNCRFFYNRSRINLNCHQKFQKENETEVNQRTITIPACGGFQLVDNPKILQKNYYTEKEVAIAHDEKEYIEKFNYYLNKPDKRHEIALNGLIKTYDNNWSLFHRLEEILEYIL